jgi:hypothetical protein
MFGIHYIKTGPTEYVIHYKNGKVQRAGTGLAFFYYQPASAIVVVPIGSADVPFIFNEISADFQPLTVQGQLTYRIRDPQLVAGLLNYSVAGKRNMRLSDDPDKLAQRLVNLVQVLTRAEVQTRPLRQAIQASDEISAAVLQQIGGSTELAALGVEVLALVVQAIKPIPEIARAMEAEAREALLRAADLATYDRRNSAVEQERRIKENELNTEIAVEDKKRQIRETKVEADLAVEVKEQQVRAARLGGQVQLEEERKQLVALQSENTRSEADAQEYVMQASLKPLASLDPQTLQLLMLQSAEPRRMVSLALKEMAQNAAKIGNLTIAPDLLEMLMKKD